MSIDATTAKIILANLRERFEVGSDGKFRLPGVVTQKEIDALDAVIAGRWESVMRACHQADVEEASEPTSPANITLPNDSVADTSLQADSLVLLDLSTLSLEECSPSFRVCMDFGTAMSKATFINDDGDGDVEEIHVLKLGIPGDQEEIDDVMLVSSAFIDGDGRLWFGQRAVEQAQIAPEGSNFRIDNIKRALSEDALEELLPATYNSTKQMVTYEDVVLAYLAYFTWTINCALASDLEEHSIPRNFRRRFAMPCFPRANARQVEGKLKTLLGEAQVLADTFRDEIDQGLPLSRFLSALKSLREEARRYPFIESSVTEPLGVAGSLLSWKSSQDSLALVVDIGAGTSDFSLYRLNVIVNDNLIRSNAGEVDGTARGLQEAGNHLDRILLGLILRKSGVDGTHPKYRNITHALERDIRFHKEALFSPKGEAAITLYTGDAVDVSLDEFLAEPAVRSFEKSLRETLIQILESAHPDWVHWVRDNPSRNLTVVLTGGGATLPMAKRLAEGTVTAHGVTIPVAAARSFPEWLRKDYPDLEETYPRVAVSLGGARKNTIHSMGVLRATGLGVGGHRLDRFATRGI